MINRLNIIPLGKPIKCKRLCYYSSMKEKIKNEKDDSIINYKMILGIKKISIGNLSSLCRDFHNIFRVNKYELTNYTNDILPFIKFMRTSEIVMILHHYSFINYNNTSFYDAIWKQALHILLNDIDCKELALVIYSMGKIKYTNKEMLLFFKKEIKKWNNRFSGRDCSLILKGLSNLNFNDTDIYNIIINRILEISDQLNLLDICIILNTYSKYKNINIQIFEVLLNKLLTFYSDMNEQCIGSILWSISNANIKSEKYFSLLTLRLRLLMHKRLLKEGVINESTNVLDDAFNVNSASYNDTNYGNSTTGNSTPDNSSAHKNDYSKTNKTQNESNYQHYNNNKICQTNTLSNNVSKEKHISSDRVFSKKPLSFIKNKDKDKGNKNECTYDDVDSMKVHDDIDDMKVHLSYNNGSYKYENIIPSIIYAYGKQKTYLKYNINIDKNLYNYIINSYNNVPNCIHTNPTEVVYIYDISKKALKNSHLSNKVNNNNNNNNNNRAITEYTNRVKNLKNKKYYKDIIYIINNYCIYFIKKVHYNDIKNVLYGITKIEMPVNKQLYDTIFELITTYVNKNLYKNYEIINLTRSLSLLPNVKNDIWLNIINCYKDNFITMASVKNNSYLFYIFSFVKNTLKINTDFDLLLIQHINKKVSHIVKDDIIYLIKGLTNLNLYNNELVINITNYIQKNNTLFNLIDVAYILKYYTIMDLRNVNIFSSLALTIKKNNTKNNYTTVSAIAKLYLQMDIYPKVIEDILMQEKALSEKNYKIEEIYCDEE
ncbi:conserved protein, unknown function [Hepatocystis sp. ex Piliocolobus tephrosceles]|nr:conserved protein, unknown function [Hepatocystis sp. ex Piliocolobus tephrosceles]